MRDLLLILRLCLRRLLQLAILLLLHELTLLLRLCSLSSNAGRREVWVESWRIDRSRKRVHAVRLERMMRMYHLRASSVRHHRLLTLRQMLSLQRLRSEPAVARLAKLRLADRRHAGILSRIGAVLRILDCLI